MATIEERAEAFIKNLNIECDKFGKEADVFIDGARAIFEAVYVKGATDQIDFLRNALIERQGEYISLELIKEIFEEYDNDYGTSKGTIL